RRRVEGRLGLPGRWAVSCEPPHDAAHAAGEDVRDTRIAVDALIDAIGPFVASPLNHAAVRHQDCPTPRRRLPVLHVAIHYRVTHRRRVRHDLFQIAAGEVGYDAGARHRAADEQGRALDAKLLL